MLKRALLATLLLLPGSLGQAQTPGDAVAMTGRVWDALAEMDKLLYVQGVKDGILIAATYLDGEERERIMDTTQARGFFPGD